jgi:hypothetical protein
VALALAADAVVDPQLAQRCRWQSERARVSTLTRPMREAGVVDCCLCHGAAGLCYFGRKWSAGARSPGLSHALRWSAWIDRQRGKGRLSYYRRRQGQEVAGQSFLDGNCGVAAALFYLASGRPPLWEELLLMKGPEHA